MTWLAEKLPTKMEIDINKISKLTLAKVCDLSGQDVRQVKRINASSKQIQQLDDLR